MSIWWVLWVAMMIAIAVIYFTTKGNEKKIFKQMIANPNDAIVLKYIQVFKKSNGFISTLMSTGKDFGVKHRDDKLRQAQGYEIVCESPNVSDSVKQNLYNVFVSEGIPVKRK